MPSPTELTLPPLDEYFTIPEAVDFHSEHNADHPMYAFSADDRPHIITTISYLEFARASHRVAHAARPRGASRKDGQVVAVIALVDTISYQAITVGLMRAGLVPFPISPRNSPPAIVNLLQKTSCHLLLATKDTLHELIEGVKAELSRNSSRFELCIEEIPGLKEIYPKLGEETAGDSFTPYPLPETRPPPADIALYLHSSGSTGFPKPIPQTNLTLSEWSSFGMHEFREYPGPRLRDGALALPSFHTLGIYTQLLEPLYGGVSVSVYPPTVWSSKAQPVLPTSDNILDHLRRTKSSSLVIIPALLQLWAQSQDAIDLLRSFVYVGYSGGPVAERLGKKLVSEGVNLKAIYGGTEFGAPTLPQLERGHEADWEWVEFSDRTNIKWVPQGDGKYECQFLTTETHHPAVVNIDNPKGYATSDLFERHPRKPHLWKIVGRKDDVIIHSSGEKTVPGPMEEIVISSPLLGGVVMFGRKHDQAGILCEPYPEHAVDVKDHQQLAQLRNKIWPLVEEANKDAPGFSRIFKEMILFTSRDKPLPRAGKGTVMRAAALKAYDEEIEELYKTVESTAGGDGVDPPDNWTAPSVRTWLLGHAKDIHQGKDFSLSGDLFEQGFDSLSATFLRLRIVGAMRSSDGLSKAAEAVSQNTVYTYPTIEKLTRFLVGIVADPEGSGDARGGKAPIEEMIGKYSTGLQGVIPRPAGDATANPDGGAVVLLTGSTGSLGSQILAFLLESGDVARVYALNRPSSGARTIEERHRARFRDRGLDVCLLGSKRVRYLEGDSAQDGLGLSPDIYEELRSSVTLIIHSAWRLDFNLGLSAFEPNVRGTRNLVDLARAGTYAAALRFLFTSSVASAQSWDQARGPYPEEVVQDASFAVGGGYGEGKYVTERVLAQSGLQACSLRIGQVSGGPPNGAWATSDWVPILVKSSLAVGALPDAGGRVSWLPMDSAAQAILDIAFAKEPPPLAVNLVHPRPLAWSALIGFIGRAVSEEVDVPGALPIVPFQGWLARVEEKAQHADEMDLEKIPAIKLLDFFRGTVRADSQMRHAEDAESGGLATFDTGKALRISGAMEGLRPIGAEDVARWVRYWRGVGFLG